MCVFKKLYFYSLQRAMSYWPGDLHPSRDGVTIPAIGIAIALSLLLHLAVIWQWKIQRPPPDKDVSPPLTVKLEPLPGPPPSIAAPPPRVAVQPPAGVPPPSAPPAVIALEPPSPVERATPAPARAPPTLDFASFIEAQRRARGEPAATPAAPATAEDENARATRLAVANLASQKAQPFGFDPNRSGGVFTIKRVGVDYAEFMFYGWHKDARRNMAQLIEVRQGSNRTIQLAVVRKMIDIIREYEQADFQWHSYRLNRSVSRSARTRDSSALEEFLMDEFFYNPRVAP